MQLKWEIEDRCNLNCKHCIVGDIKYPKSMSIEKAKKVVNMCVENDIDSIALTTKEPFMYTYLSELIEYCSLYNIKIAILTNGTLMNDKNLQMIEKYSGNIKYLFFSLEGVSEETNDYVRGKGVFKKVIDAANKINEINKKEDTFIRMVLQLNLTSKNYKEVQEMVGKFNTFPFIQVRIGKLEIEGNAILHDDLQLNNKEYDNSIEELIQTYKQLNDSKYDLTYKSLSLYDSIYINTVFETSFKPNIPECSVFEGNFSLMNNGDYCACSLLLHKNFIDKEKIIFGNLEDSTPMIKSREFEVTPEMMEYKETSTCKKCRFNSNCKLCLLISLSDENKFEQVKHCQFYMNKLDEIFNDIKADKTDFKFNKNIVVTEEKGQLKLYNSEIIDKDEYWTYSTDNEYIKNVIYHIYDEDTSYMRIKTEFNNINIEELVYNLLYSGLITVTNS